MKRKVMTREEAEYCVEAVSSPRAKTLVQCMVEEDLGSPRLRSKPLWDSELLVVRDKMGKRMAKRSARRHKEQKAKLYKKTKF